MMRYLLDSNLIIEHLNGAEQATAFIREHATNGCISVITKIEVLGFPFPTPKAESAAHSLIHALVIIGLNDRVVGQTIILRKARKIKVPDAIIASTSLQHQLVLVTRNTDDFQGIEGLTCLNPFTAAK